MKEICLTCQHFRATDPWCGRCKKAPDRTNYTKDRCGFYRPADADTLAHNLNAVEFFKEKHPESIDRDLIGLDINE